MSAQAAASDRTVSPLLRSTAWIVTETLCRDWMRLLGAFEIRLGPRREMQVAAFLGELPGAGQADALGRAGDESDLAAQIQIHANLLVLSSAPTPGRFGTYILRAKIERGTCLARSCFSSNRRWRESTRVHSGVDRFDADGTRVSGQEFHESTDVPPPEKTPHSGVAG